MTERVLVTEQHLGRTSEPTLRDLSEALIAVYGTDYGIHSPIWISRFTDRLGRPRPTETDGCCWLATRRTWHVHSPVGEGPNTGVQDVKVVKSTVGGGYVREETLCKASLQLVLRMS